MSLSYEMKKKYAETINALFDGAVRATPDQINVKLCLYTDKMILDITNCSKNITNFAFNVFLLHSLSRISLNLLFNTRLDDGFHPCLCWMILLNGVP